MRSWRSLNRVARQRVSVGVAVVLGLLLGFADPEYQAVALRLVPPFALLFVLLPHALEHVPAIWKAKHPVGAVVAAAFYLLAAAAIARVAGWI